MSSVVCLHMCIMCICENISRFGMNCLPLLNQLFNKNKEKNAFALPQVCQHCIELSEHGWLWTDNNAHHCLHGS